MWKLPGNNSIRAAAMLAGLVAALPTIAGGIDHRQHLAMMSGTADAADPHAHHRHMMMQRQDYQRSEHDYRPPDLPLMSMDGRPTSLPEELAGDQPVLLNFIFATCTTICPVLSASFSSVQQQLEGEPGRVRMLSITIDPEHDTPDELRAYAARFNAGPDWRFLTGDLDNIVAIQKAFDAYWGNKTNHEPATFLRAGKGASWVRIDGLASAAAIIGEYRRITGSGN